MQVSSVNGVNFKSRLTPEVLEARAEALQNTDFDLKAQEGADIFVDAIDKKLQKSEAGRKVIGFVVSAAGFAAAALSFKRVAPKLRTGIAAATKNIAQKAGNMLGKNNKNINELTQTMAEQTEVIASGGTVPGFQKGIKRLLGEPRGEKVVGAFEKVGIKTGGDVADTTVAIGAATLAGREAGDIADDKTEEMALKGAIKDLAKVASAITGAGAEVMLDV